MPLGGCTRGAAGDEVAVAGMPCPTGAWPASPWATGADADAGAVSFRLRDGEQINGVPVDQALDHIAAVIAGRVNDPAGERPARD